MYYNWEHYPDPTAGEATRRLLQAGLPVAKAKQTAKPSAQAATQPRTSGQAQRAEQPQASAQAQPAATQPQRARLPQPAQRHRAPRKEAADE
ncbi:MAG: hypothetical protein PHO10_12150 [Gemmiger sp.]|nr:hypothetical protein [Gemmiger sp.]